MCPPPCLRGNGARGRFLGWMRQSRWACRRASSETLCDVSETSPLPYGGAADARTAGLSLSARFRRHADALIRDGRSRLCAQLMYDAASDIEAGGLTARMFSDVPAPPGSVPQLRLLAALHHLVLAGRAPELAAFYPSAGGELALSGVWSTALATIEANFEWIHQRLARTVQTNEPGRSSVLYAALLWLVDRYGLPIRLLEIGASAGLNLIPDRYSYLVGGAELGDQSSPVRFEEPWQRRPAIDVHTAANQLRLEARGGCDRRPLDPRDGEDRLTLLSYIWPDELERIARMRAALELLAADPVPITAQPASQWLEEALAQPSLGTLTVIWQSLFRQYVDRSEWTAIEHAIRAATAAGLDLVWLVMEPGDDHLARVRLAIRSPDNGSERLLARCGDHGPPVLWIEQAHTAGGKGFNST